MTTIEFLSYLNSLGIQVFANGERLRINAPKGVLTPNLRTELAERKGELLAFLHQANLTANATPSRILPVSRDEHLPLSFAQQRLWFLDQLEPGDSTYNLTAAYCLSGPLNVIVLEQSFNEIVRRHEVLRTTFADEEWQPEQVIAEELRLRLTIEDLQELPETKRETEARRQVEEEAQRPFNLAQGPLLRASLLRLRPEEHILQLAMHHIVSDGWSMGVLFGELASLYEAYSSGKLPGLPELTIQYADFAVWQREWLQGEVLASQLGYWKQQLEGAPHALELPTDRPRTAVQSHQGATQSISLTKNLTDALKILSRQEGVTLYMTLLAAFKVLLHRYAGQDDIVVGSPIANRNRPEIEGLIGFFVNTLVLRTDLTGNPTFRELLARVREVALGAYAHQDLPFEKLVEELHPERDPSRTPLFQVMFVLQNNPRPTQEFTRLSLSPVAVENITAKFDLTLSMREQGDRLRGTLNYNTDLFDGATMKRLVGHLQVLLESIAADPEQRLSEVSILTAAERRQLLEEWNNTRLDYPKDQCVHELFEVQVERRPEAVAVVFEEQQLTYDQLNSLANQLAHYLRKRGVGPEVIVGLCVERSLEMVVGLLGILKAGGAYVPLDPSYPPERLALMVEDSRIPLLLAEEQLLETLPTEDVEVICLDLEGEAIAQESVENLVANITTNNLAYVIYTSGSTGRPKGAMIHHQALCNHMMWMQTEFGFDQTDRVLQKTPMSFDPSVWEFYGPLFAGGQLILARSDGHRDGHYLVETIINQKITTLRLVPSQLQMLLDVGGLENCHSLQRVFCGGEALSVELVNRLVTVLPTADLINLYGPTEATIVTTYWTYQNQPNLVTVPIGRPIANAQIYLLDSNLCPVPIGVPGELHIGGVGVGRGYLNRPKLTAEKFIPNPFSDEPAARLYKTGDMARYRPDGHIEFLGRIDHQVKIRGFRIELGEVETTLKQHPSVRESVALAREDVPGDKRLVAYVVPDQEQTPTIRELRDFLKRKLPEYMIPSAYVMLETPPLTPNGKIDRQALPEPVQTRSELENVYVAPRTPVEEAVVGLWVEILGLEQVGIYDDFFELGGHSLLATQIISRLRSVFQIELPLRSLFEAPTVAGLAETIEANRWIVEDTQQVRHVSATPIEPVPRAGALPLSFAQQRLWFLEQLEPDQPTYNLGASYRLSGRLEVRALEQGLNEIVRRHEVLRTTISDEEWQPEQVIAEELRLRLRIEDLQKLPEAERETEARWQVEEEAQRPFNLAQGPLLRASLLRLRPEEHLLQLTMHHIVSDGWSMGVLFEELASLYEAYASGKRSSLAELPIQYADFAVWQREWLQGEVLASQLGYWKQQLEGAPHALELPTDRPRTAVQSHQGATQSISLTKNLTDALKILSRQEGVTLYMTLLAAFKVLLHRYAGQDDIVVGSPIANRNRPEIEGLIGFFVNTLVLRTDLTGNPTFRELLARVREVALGAYAHQDLPFEKLVEELHPERDPSRTPLFQVMFVLQNTPGPAQEFTHLNFSPVAMENRTAKFDLTLSMREQGDRLRGTLNYNTDLFDGATMKRLVGHLQVLLESIAADPEQRLSEVSILTAAECRQLLVEWNNTWLDYPKDECVHELFEAQAERTPEAVAVVFEEQQLTYGQLNSRANQLGHYLRKRGVGPEVIVGLCVERSLEMVVGLLGIFKAGGAYVPLDPGYPTERLAFMLADTQAPVLLTQQHLVARLPKENVNIICLDTNWTQISQESQKVVVSEVKPHHQAYVIYTSGSTGRPKGVQIEHKSLLNLVYWHQTEFNVTAADRATQIASIAFDASVWELWPYLTVGASIYCPNEETRLSPEQLRDWLVSQGITISFLPTPLAERMLMLNWPTDITLRTLLTGGDKLHHYPPTDLPFELVNNYGPTENSVVTTSGGITPQKVPHLAPPIGRPITNVQLYILDMNLQPVPIGVPGELYIGGSSLARGYLNRPELTVEQFIANPLTEEAGTRLYKTGDLVRYLPDGTVEFIGRVDHQVKIRGFRIELGEIETVLGQHPAVQKNVILAQEDSTGSKRLVAYVVPSQELAPMISELRKFLKQKLPGYMIPSAFVTLDTLPLSPNGKVDRQALPAPDLTRPEMEAAHVAPQNEVEQTIADIWQDLLGIKQIGVYDNFFDLGGDSILGLQIIARANKARLQLTPQQIFEHQTIAELAAVSGTASVIKAEQGLVTGSAPLTPIQHWFFEQKFPDPHHWNQSILLEVQQIIAPAVLDRIVQQLILRHDSLRLRFIQKESGWQQIVASSDETVSVLRMDLSALSESEQGPAMESAAADFQAGLNLSEGPIMQVILFDLGPHKPSRLLLVIHHLAIDAVSWRILLADLEVSYQQLSQGEEIQLPPKTTSFKYWTQCLADYRLSAALQAELDYWLTEPWTQAGPLPVDYPEKKGGNIEVSARTISVSLDIEETRVLLQEVPKAYNTQINDVLLTALVQTFKEWTGQRYLLVDLEGHGREAIFEDVDLSRTVGWFTTIFPVLLNLGKVSDPSEVLKSIKEQLRRIPNNGIGYGLLRYLSKDTEIVKKLQAIPQAELSFNYLGQFDQTLSPTSPFKLTNESCGPMHSLRGTRSHLLAINGRIIKSQLQLDWIYSENLHRHATIEVLAESYITALRVLIAHCQSSKTTGYTPSDFPEVNLSQQELDDLIAELGEATE